MPRGGGGGAGGRRVNITSGENAVSVAGATDALGRAVALLEICVASLNNPRESLDKVYGVS